MAKGKEKRRSSTGNTTTSRQNDTDAGDSLPTLPEGALANLTRNIEQKLQNNENVKPGPRRSSVTKNDKESQSISKPVDKKGKKRDRNGKVKAPKPDAASKPDGSKAPEANDVLEKEIYAIGGDRDDYDLIAGIESDSEVEGSDHSPAKGGGKKNDYDGLRKDIAKLLGAGDADKNVRSDAQDGVKQKPAPQKPKALPQEDKPAKAATKAGKETKVQSVNEKPSTKSKTSSKAPGSDLLISPRPDWFSAPLPDVTSTGKHNFTVARHIVDRIREYASSLLEAENNAFSNHQQSSSTHRFYSTIVSSGTLSDKISALTLAVQESPLHNTKALDTLIGLARKRSRAQAVEVLRSLKDLFAQGTLLPGDRKLRALSHQPALLAAFERVSPNWTSADGLPNGLEKQHLIFWAFEDFVKDQYFEVLKILEVWCNDELEFPRTRAVSYVYELLKEKPEQESNLLRLLVNKLGDPNKKIASRASYLLLQLEQAHPLMKSTIVSAVETEFLFRPGQSKHAQYYGVITLNQTVLSGAEESVAVQLLDIYFSLFLSLLKKPKDAKESQPNTPANKKGKKRNKHQNTTSNESQEGEIREKLISAILAGVNRAYPFTSSNTERLSNHMNTLFQITHSSNFNTSIQALMLIQQLSSTHQVSADRFYRTLYESLLDPRIATSSKQSMYLNLLYKALKADLNMKRVKAFVKRLIQILSLHQPSFICGVFYLIRELETAFPSLISLLDQPEDYASDEEEVFRDVPDEDDEGQKEAVDGEHQSQRTRDSYDSRKRDPEQSNADKSCLWELLPYLSHYHPSVAVGAVQLLNQQKMSGKPDLTIHTLSHFLDRFVYRAPKADAGLRGSSVMQPLSGNDANSLLVMSGRSGKAQAPVNSESFWKKKSEDVAVEDAFFHDYFNRLGKDKQRTQQKAAQKKKKTAEEESEEESEAESDVWKALVDSKPEVGGGLESDEDNFDMDDFKDAMDGSGDEEGGMEEDADELMGSDSDSGVIFNDEDEESADEEEASAPAASKTEDTFEDEDSFNMDVSDDEAFRDSDEDVPSDLGIEEEQEEEAPAPEKKQDSKREKKRKLKHLPTFASADDYAALLADEDTGGGS